MNERIEKLKEQAGLDCDECAYLQDSIAEFAKLIVQECVDILDKEVYLATREDGEQAYIDVMLLEYFGVN